MKKLILSLFVVVFVVSLFADNVMQKMESQPKFSAKNSSTSRDEVVVYEQTFENDWDGWQTIDGTLPSTMWHPDDFDTPDGTGTAWWMGDPELGGYLNQIYVVLDSDPIEINSGDHLTFDMNYAIEAPAGAEPPYDGWDGANVRVSIDGGETWEVIEGQPAYTSESMYSFGFEHDEGPDIPGWGGTSDGWVSADFDLSAYAGENLMVRFAFASDPAYCTQDDPSLFGIIVDNIAIGESYFNDGTDDGTLTASSVVPVGGDIWHIGEVDDAPSPTHAAICQNESGTYNPGMIDILESPAIEMPASGEIRVDYMIKGGFTDPDEFPEVDYHGWEVSPDGGATWYAMSNPDGDPDGDNYVYSDCPDIWSSMVESYSLEGRLDGFTDDNGDPLYEGNDNVKFRIYFQTDQDTPEGMGIMIDNFTVTNEIYLGDPPSDLTAMTQMDGSVMLNWVAPGSGTGEEGWLNYDSGENNDGIGTGSAADILVAAKFGSDMLIEGELTKIKFFPYEADCDYTLKVWTGSNGDELLYEQAVPSPTIEAWNEIELDTPVAIDPSQYLWIGYNANTQTGYPCGCDAGPMQPDGGYIKLGGETSWSTLFDYGLDYNWNIQGYQVGMDGETVVLNNDRDRDVTGYNIYRSLEENVNYEMIDTIDPAEEYIDENPEQDAYNYYIVKAIYDDEAESAESNVAYDYVPGENAVVLYNDDGSSESGYEATNMTNIAVKFEPTYEDDDIDLTHFRIYLEEVSTAQFIFRIWDDDGGMPGNQVAQFTQSPSEMQEGWNFVELQEPVTFSEGNFFVGIFAMSGLSTIGLDEDTSGYSYVGDQAGQTWEMITEGNLMIRALVEGAGSDADDINIPASQVTLNNYPNPFNPTTTISYNLPESGKVSLKIYNLKGQLVNTLVNEKVDAGYNSISWSGKDSNNNDVTSGVYLYRLETATKTITKKMLMLK